MTISVRWTSFEDAAGRSDSWTLAAASRSSLIRSLTRRSASSARLRSLISRTRAIMQDLPEMSIIEAEISADKNLPVLVRQVSSLGDQRSKELIAC